MPVLFFLTATVILYILILPFKDTATLLVNAVTVTNKEEMAQKSIFNEDKAKDITPINDKIPSSQVEYPTLGTEYGAVVVNKHNIESKLIYGDSLDDLRTGIGHFNGSVFPGEPGTTLIGGHNTADLAILDQVEVGEMISIKTSYETYEYEVKEKKVLKYNDQQAIESLYEKSDNNQLILYTCYPISMIGLTEDRLFVYAERVSGKMIDLDN